MYADYPPSDHRTYRHAPALSTTLALAALPLAALLAAAYPAATVALLFGLLAGRATRR
ncbi:hypothetical protein HUG10_14245 [Halorarum halophilum]|uniref:Uncharacterized protein n=1 Tax=Halorarum halophilum TaxID=2743090 RepID=A0A7D5K914_9EURY|nr:hypothetical protein [Halobaculum halophilum]QLG28634.1 hypothetical protein HUG10_14245 [Halobaculum halophilum]